MTKLLKLAPEKLLDGVFLERPNRYLARVRVGRDGEETFAHVPDPGRLPGLLLPGCTIRLALHDSPQRKTRYSLVLVRHGGIWVSVYPAFANKLVADALARKAIPFLKGFCGWTAEAKYGSSRFDFKLDYPERTAFVEVKSVSFVESGIGRFPDAPTERGRRHVEELIKVVKGGGRGIVLFVSQRKDTRRITTNDAVDPEFGECLRRARQAGVELYGYNCKVTAGAISLLHPVGVFL